MMTGHECPGPIYRSRFELITATEGGPMMVGSRRIISSDWELIDRKHRNLDVVPQKTPAYHLGMGNWERVEVQSGKVPKWTKEDYK
jgi:hypothetical protein